MSEPFQSYLTCVKKYCGIKNDPDTGKFKYLAEKNSDYISNFILNLGHPTKERYQTKVFDVAENPTVVELKNLLPFPAECPSSRSGVITTFLIPNTENCSRDVLNSPNLFLSVETDCDFTSGLKILIFLAAKAQLNTRTCLSMVKPDFLSSLTSFDMLWPSFGHALAMLWP